jgi:RNA-directed DNA polymerase
MIDLKKELNNLEIYKEISSISLNDYKEFRVKNNFFYTLRNESLLKKQKQFIHILNNIMHTNSSSYAYTKNLSYYDFLLPHVHNYNFIRLDIKSFFHSIKEKYIRFVFQNYFKNQDNTSDLLLEDNTKAIDSFIKLIMIDLSKTSINKKYRNCKILPIGFPLSPIISNVVFRPLDLQIEKLCKDNGITYSRYADDMLFSSSKINIEYIHTIKFIESIQLILSQFDFRLNNKKTLKSTDLLSLNGIVLNNGTIRLSNKKLDFIKKIIHYNDKLMKSPKEILLKLFKYDLPPKCHYFPMELETFYKDQYVFKLAGYRSYLVAIIKFSKFNNILDEEIYKKYNNLLVQLEKIIEEN